MAAIIGKKVGMTQVFGEDGTRVPVTVIEAGPCPVTAVREPERDGYAAVQLGVRRGRGAQAHQGRARPPEEGRRAAACARWSSSATRTCLRGGPKIGDARKVDAVRARPDGQGLRRRDRQGLPGHDQAPQLLPRPDDPRLAQRPRAGLDRRQRRSRPRLQGHEDAGPDGRQARHPAPAGGLPGRRREQPAAGPGRGPRRPKSGTVEVRSDG